MASKSIRPKRRPRIIFQFPLISLMWPSGRAPAEPRISVWENDLGLGELVQALTSEPRYAPFIRSALAALNTDPQVIAWRQAILADFLENSRLNEAIQALLPKLTELKRGHALFDQSRRNVLLEIADRLAELQLYLETVQELHASLQAAELRSAGLRTLRESLAALLQDEGFRSLREELPELQAPFRSLSSLTIGINLDAQLQPVAAVLLAINGRPFGEAASLLERLLGFRVDSKEGAGIAPMHHVPENPAERKLSSLFQDLEQLLARVAQPIARALDRYVRLNSGTLVGLESELAFYVAAVGLISRLQARGVAFCQPEIVPIEERATHIDDLVNVNLAIRMAGEPVPSDADLGPEGRIAILTGPNSGGKTTYVQAVGLAHVLAQAGLFIPARLARLSPVDAILTHFPAQETRQQGRLAEEAERLRDIFRRATAHSLVLLNESLSSTEAGEALYLAHDVVCGLRVIGVQAVYATHLIELARRTAEIEAAVAGESGVFSVVAGIELAKDAVPTFRMARGTPLGRSYAQEIARRHGISLEQILAARNRDKSSDSSESMG